MRVRGRARVIEWEQPPEAKAVIIDSQLAMCARSLVGV